MAEAPKTSRNIPLPIQREVRQRCGFGCVICGFPLYEYEHMKEWAVVKRHVADEITLLCDQHHREKTAGLLPKEEVIEANKDPYNLRNGVSKPYNLHYKGDSAQVVIGNVAFENKDTGYGTQLIPIMIDRIPIVGIILADGHFLLNMVLFDEFNNILLQIKNNQLIYKTDAFDIQLVGRTLTIREKLRKILIEIRFETPNRIIISKGRFLANGVEIIIDESKILVNSTQNSFANFTIKAMAGLVIGDCDIPSVFKIENVNRYKK